MLRAKLVPSAIHGFCDYRFRAVREAFAANFAQHLEVGASVAVEVEGRPVVDLWAGYADRDGTRAWRPDTLVNVYSCTKGLVALCANRLADQGLLDMDLPVARYWPEFAWARKGSIPVRYLLNHRAGLPAIREPLPLRSQEDWNVMTDALARSETWWEPGTRHGYHVLTFGWLVGEVVRRIARQSVGAYAREIAGLFGIDFHIGLKDDEHQRVAEVLASPQVWGDDGGPFAERMKDKDSMAYKAMGNPRDGMAAGLVNTHAWRAAEIPAANGHANARSMARLYSVLADRGSREGKALLSPQAIAQAVHPESEGEDAVLGIPTRFGLGFMLPSESCYFGPSANAFGHPGAGGSSAFADPDARLGFGYAMNQLHGRLGQEDPRRRRLIDAVYTAL